MITAPDLCLMTGYDYQAFRTRRRRMREMFRLERRDTGEPLPVIDSDDYMGQLPPLRDLGEGHWARYEADDVMRLAVCMEAHRAGLPMSDASRFTWSACPNGLWLDQRHHTGGLWIARVTTAGGLLRHVCCGFAEILKYWAADDGPPTSAILLDATAIVRRMHERAAEMGLSAALGWTGSLGEQRT